MKLAFQGTYVGEGHATFDGSVPVGEFVAPDLVVTAEESDLFVASATRRTYLRVRVTTEAKLPDGDWNWSSYVLVYDPVAFVGKEADLIALSHAGRGTPQAHALVAIGETVMVQNGYQSTLKLAPVGSVHELYAKARAERVVFAPEEADEEMAEVEWTSAAAA